MEEVLKQHEKLIKPCASRICHKFQCRHMYEDLLSIGSLVLIQKMEDYREDSHAALSTYLYKHLMGAMIREVERTLDPIALPKTIF